MSRRCQPAVSRSLSSSATRWVTSGDAGSTKAPGPMKRIRRELPLFSTLGAAPESSSAERAINRYELWAGPAAKS